MHFIQQYKEKYIFVIITKGVEKIESSMYDLYVVEKFSPSQISI